jgi:mitochondrial fission protein ELM1
MDRKQINVHLFENKYSTTLIPEATTRSYISHQIAKYLPMTQALHALTHAFWAALA